MELSFWQSLTCKVATLALIAAYVVKIQEEAGAATAIFLFLVSFYTDFAANLEKAFRKMFEPVKAPE